MPIPGCLARNVLRRRPPAGAAVRQRITIAHELGRAVLHGREGSEPVDVLIDALEPKVQVGLDNQIDRIARGGASTALTIWPPPRSIRR